MRNLLMIALALIVIPSATGAPSITATSPVTAAGATLNGLDQAPTFPVVTTIVNTGGGSNSGWNETASATIPSSGGRLLPALIVTAVSSTAGTAAPVNAITWPITLSATAVKVFNASAGSGKGTMTVTHTFKITYPSNVLLGTYASTVTFAVASGP